MDKKPTKPGYYWTKELDHPMMRPYPCKIHQYESPKEMVIRFVGKDGEQDLYETQNREWYGPIEPPQ